MPSKLGLLTLLLAAFVCCEPLVPRSGASTCVQNLQVYIYAGNNLKTGVVTLSSTQSGVVITITQQNGWQLTSADLYIGRNTSPCSLSSFPYRTGTLNRLTTYTWTIPFSAFGCNQIVNVAVHTVSVNPSLRNTGCGSQSTPSESCWAAGRSFASGYGYSFQWNICCVSPTTAVPTTKVATTQVPTTRVPTTRVPTTRVPTTRVPTTAVPTTKVPTTAVPTTRAATTRVATTRVATTRAATTRYVATTKHAATTAVPTTRNPTTRVPTTAVPTTRVPTTAVPTTAIPTTAIPTTAVPTTDVPTTDVPTTAVPTTGVATTGDVTPPPPPPYPYGTCDDKYHFFGYFPSFFNTYVYRNITCYNSDTEGRIAAGGAIDLYNYGVACKLYTPAGVAQCSYNVTCDDIADDYGDIVDSVIAGGDVSIIQGSVYVGNIAIGGVFNNDITVVWGAGCTLFQGEVIDFDSTFDFLKNLAATVAQENSTGTIVNNWGSLTFQGTNNTDIEVFDIDASLLCSVYGITLDLTTVAPTASVFVNVAGDGFTCQNYQLNNFNASQTLWNFYEATTFSLQNIRWPGSILAPWAFVNGANSGVIDGQVFVDSWYSNTNCMQQNWTPFVGCLPSAGHIPSDDY